MEQQVAYRIERMRRGGMSYGQISQALGLSRSTVKSHCQRRGIQPGQKRTEEDVRVCQFCAKAFEDSSRVSRKFCDSKCRLGWWHAHPEHLNRRAIYSFTCAHCGQGFSAYGNKGRKYCCHACYVRARFGTKGGRR